MRTRPEPDPRTPRDAAEARQGGVFGREWWGLDRDRLEDELARQDRQRPDDRTTH